MSEITTLLFDFVGVLLEANPQAKVPPKAAAIDRQIGKVTDDRLFRQSVLAEYRLTENEFEAVLDQVVGQFRPFEPLWRILPDLRRRFRLGIINNGTYLTYPRFNAKFALDRQFDLFISSAVEGIRKPDPRIYLRACQKLGVPPQCCLFMDDSPANVTGAEQAGMRGLVWATHLAGFQLLLHWLEQNGLSFPPG
jgi:HAD superfamily hydrolase (TIGR01509 family)